MDKNASKNLASFSDRELELMKIIELTRGIGRSGLQKWAEAANGQCERATEESRAKGQHRHGKKTPLAESVRQNAGR